MIKNNKFYFNELRNVVILGNLESLEVTKKINDSLKLNTFLITSPSFKNNSKNIKITMRCFKTNIAMGIEDHKNNVFGFQFHPESFLTKNGKILIKKILST